MTNQTNEMSIAYFTSIQDDLKAIHKEIKQKLNGGFYSTDYVQEKLARITRLNNKIEQMNQANNDKEYSIVIEYSSPDFKKNYTRIEQGNEEQGIHTRYIYTHRMIVRAYSENEALFIAKQTSEYSGYSIYDSWAN